jgi:uncharacterized protein (TIGR03000 family)
MTRRSLFLALPALALACLLILPETSSAQLFGRRSGYYGGGYYGGGYGGGYYGGGSYDGYGGMYGRGGYSLPGYYPYTWGMYGRGGPSPYFSGSPPMYYSGPYGFQGAPGSGILQAGYESQYPPGDLNQNRGRIQVRVPTGDARVLFDDSPTKQTGTERLFETPALDPAKAYSYEVSARWMENGQERRETRTIRPIPGRVVYVDFTQPASNVPLPTDQKERLQKQTLPKDGD